MAHENVELVKRSYTYFNDRDLDRAASVFAEDAEWVPHLAALEQEIYRGRDDIERMWREVLRDLPDLQIDVVAAVAALTDTVVAEVEFQGVGKASGAATGMKIFQAVTLREGRVVRVQGCHTAAEAFEAAGLPRVGF